MHKIFISYSRRDYPTVIRLKEEIESHIGYGSCWIDMSGIESDRQFVDTIIEAIDQADIFLFMYSAHSERSEWTRKEIEYAHSEKKRIVFVNIDKTPLSKYFKFQFGGHDIIDMRDKLQKQKLIGNLSCWCSSSTEDKKEDNVRETHKTTSPIKGLAGKCQGLLRKQSVWHAIRLILCFLIKTLLYINAFFSVIYLWISCTDGYDSSLMFFVGLMSVLSIIAWIFVHFKLIRITFKHKVEEAVLFGIPILLYLCSFSIYQNKTRYDDYDDDTITIADSAAVDSVEDAFECYDSAEVPIEDMYECCDTTVPAE